MAFIQIPSGYGNDMLPHLRRESSTNPEIRPRQIHLVWRCDSLKGTPTRIHFQQWTVPIWQVRAKHTWVGNEADGSQDGAV
jgi:hypothetical protein